MLTIIGDDPFKKDPAGNPRSQIATIFPEEQVLVTLPGIHATHKTAFVDMLQESRKKAGQRPLTEDEQVAEWEEAIDLIIEDQTVLIRPDPDHMELAFAADELLQTLVPKRRIKFLHVLNDKVRKAIQQRGEAWRIHPLPKSAEQMTQMIAASRIGITGKPLYYYNAGTGSRWLTYQDFAALQQLGGAELRKYLGEIAHHCPLLNQRGRPEIDFFMAGHALTAVDFAGARRHGLDDAEVRGVYEQIRAKFRAAVPAQFQRDDPHDCAWRNHMYCALIDHRGDLLTEESLLGLSSEFFMQVDWLPGARLEDGELMFDSVFEDPDAKDPIGGGAPCDDNVRGVICNLIQEFGELDYVNIGRVIGSLSYRAPMQGRREVYVAQIKQRGAADEILQIIRMQKWGVREHLDDGQDLLQAMIESEEYTEYCMDRRLGCKQLGMNLPQRIFTRKLSETYVGRQTAYHGRLIWSPYFQRDYLSGVATDKMPMAKLRNPEYAAAFATLLGRAAAPNMIVGRARSNGTLLFDDGDEIIIEDKRQMPIDIVVADGTGTLNHYQGDLRQLAPSYAEPINRRLEYVPDPSLFLDRYIAAFTENFTRIQKDYRDRRRGLDSLFKHRRRDTGGSFAYRWECVLHRLDTIEAAELAELIRKNVRR